MTSIFTKGSAAATGTANKDEMASTATEIRGLRDQILSLANSEVNGRHIFSGSDVLNSPFAISGDVVTYQGDMNVNSVEVAPGYFVRQNVPGDSIFSSVFSAVNGLLTALDSGDQAAAQTALKQFSGAVGNISQTRAQVGSDLGVLQDLEGELDTRGTNLKTRQTQIEDANLAEVATELTRIQTALKATLTAASLVNSKNNLFDFLA
jgi:flagellar hook-associated protein 3 FlgL